MNFFQTLCVLRSSVSLDISRVNLVCFTLIKHTCPRVTVCDIMLLICPFDSIEIILANIAPSHCDERKKKKKMHEGSVATNTKRLNSMLILFRTQCAMLNIGLINLKTPGGSHSPLN